MKKLPVFAISPIHTTLDFPDDWTLENKIDIFVARIEGWQLDVAKQIIQNQIPHRGFALLHIVFSYFEMIGKYLHGYVGKHEPKIYFKRGVKATFPEIGEDEEALLETLWSSVRNGLYHVGSTRVNVILRDDIPGSIGFNPENNTLILSPDRLVEDLDIRFHDYVRELRNPEKTKLRANFEARFDYDNSDTNL